MLLSIAFRERFEISAAYLGLYVGCDIVIERLVFNGIFFILS